MLGTDETGLAEMKNSCALVIVGGGSFARSPRRPWTWSMRHFWRYERLAFLAARSGIPFGIFGVEAGKMIDNPLLRRLARQLFEKAVLPSVRSEKSDQFLRSIGINHDIPVSPDSVVFGNSNAFKGAVRKPPSCSGLIGHYLSTRQIETQTAIMLGRLSALADNRPSM